VAMARHYGKDCQIRYATWAQVASLVMKRSGQANSRNGLAGRMLAEYFVTRKLPGLAGVIRFALEGHGQCRPGYCHACIYPGRVSLFFANVRKCR
jgi:hypothetical protein